MLTPANTVICKLNLYMLRTDVHLASALGRSQQFDSQRNAEVTTHGISLLNLKKLLKLILTIDLV